MIRTMLVWIVGWLGVNIESSLPGRMPAARVTS